jgi:hypothetical protein
MDDEDEDIWDLLDDDSDSHWTRFFGPADAGDDADDEEEAEPEPGDFWLDRCDENDD